MVNNRCVYLHRLNGEVVYIGSGSHDRIKSRSCRSKEHLIIWDELEFEVVIGNIDRENSLIIEQALIDAYSLTGKLLNKRRKVAKTNFISYAEIFEKFELSSDSPSWLRWKTRNGNIAGSLDKNRGYYRISYKDTTLLAHRIVWVLSNQSDLSSNFVVDHINRDVSDNSPENLRATSQSENCRNREHRLPKTGLKYIYEKNNGFHVKVIINGIWKTTCFYYGQRFQKETNLGMEDARLAALDLAIKFRDKHLENTIQCNKSLR